MKVIAFTGMPFSGKSEAVKVAKKLGFPVVRMGDAVWEEVKKQDLNLNDKNVGMIANEMRKKYGRDIWAKRTLDKIRSLKVESSAIVIDGVRNAEEIDIFKKEFDKDFILIAIEASDYVRHMRALKRDRQDDSKNLVNIKERDKREISWGIDVVIASADIVVSNENGIDGFRENIRKMLSKI